MAASPIRSLVWMIVRLSILGTACLILVDRAGRPADVASELEFLGAVIHADGVSQIARVELSEDQLEPALESLDLRSSGVTPKAIGQLNTLFRRSHLKIATSTKTSRERSSRKPAAAA